MPSCLFDLSRYRKELFACVLCVCLFSVYTFTNPDVFVSKRVSSILDYRKSVRHKTPCADFLSSVVQGKWKTRTLTSSEQNEMEAFLRKARDGHHIPRNLERPDQKCGNTTFDWLKQFSSPSLWFRALCNPKGDKPCCKDGRCVTATVEQCRCHNCYDMRQQIHAEHSKWIANDSNCQPEDFDQSDACNLLHGSSLYFIGDSFIRHVYTAMVLLLRNDFQYGAMQPYTPQDTKENCKGMYMFTEKVCRNWLQHFVSVCHHNVSLTFIDHASSIFGSALPGFVKRLANTTRSFLFLGLGIHENYNSKSVINGYIRPLVDTMYKTRQIWPRVLWASPHAPGLLKTPRIKEQNSQSVRKYNQDIREYLNSWGIPVFDTFNLTDGVMSFDGAHYGLGVNTLKAQMALNYIQELQTDGLW